MNEINAAASFDKQHNYKVPLALYFMHALLIAHYTLFTIHYSLFSVLTKRNIKQQQEKHHDDGYHYKYSTRLIYACTRIKLMYILLVY